MFSALTGVFSASASRKCNILDTRVLFLDFSDIISRDFMKFQNEFSVLALASTAENPSVIFSFASWILYYAYLNIYIFFFR